MAVMAAVILPGILGRSDSCLGRAADCHAICRCAYHLSAKGLSRHPPFVFSYHQAFWLTCSTCGAGPYYDGEGLPLEMVETIKSTLSWEIPEHRRGGYRCRSWPGERKNAPGVLGWKSDGDPAASVAKFLNRLVAHQRS